MNKWVRLYIQIFVVFIVMFLVSFIPELYPDLFGDWKCGGYYKEYLNGTYKIVNDKCLYTESNHNPKYHWGWRHWLLFVSGWVYTIVSITKMIDDFDKKEEEKATLKWYEKPAADIPIRVSHTDPDIQVKLTPTGPSQSISGRTVTGIHYITGPRGE